MRVDHDHELQVHDIIRLPSEASADHDPDSQIQFFCEEHEKWINFRNKTENVKSFKSFLQEREPYG